MIGLQWNLPSNHPARFKKSLQGKGTSGTRFLNFSIDKSGLGDNVFLARLKENLYASRIHDTLAACLAKRHSIEQLHAQYGKSFVWIPIPLQYSEKYANEGIAYAISHKAHHGMAKVSRFGSVVLSKRLERHMSYSSGRLLTSFDKNKDCHNNDISSVAGVDGGGCMLIGHMIYLLKLNTDDCKTAPWLYLKWDDVQQRYLLFAARTFPPRTTVTFVTRWTKQAGNWLKRLPSKNS